MNNTAILMMGAATLLWAQSSLAGGEFNAVHSVFEESCLCDHHDRPDYYAPVGVRGDHRHSKGGLMFSYRYMSMKMSGLRNGSRSVSSEEVFQSGYSVAPLEMQMDMHMLGFMYAPSDRVTLMLMAPYVVKEMTMERNAGAMAMSIMRNKEEGFGDLSLGSLWKLYRTEKQQAHLNLGLSIPVAEKSDAFYNMQNGSGTWDVTVGATWQIHQERYSLGAQILGTFRLGENDRGYRFPNELNTTTWASYLVTDKVSVNTRLSYKMQGNFHGTDDSVMMVMSPTMDPSNLPVDRLDWSLGVNMNLGNNAHLGVEWGMPIYEDTQGTRLSLDWWMSTGVKWLW